MRETHPINLVEAIHVELTDKGRKLGIQSGTAIETRGGAYVVVFKVCPEDASAELADIGHDEARQAMEGDDKSTSAMSREMSKYLVPSSVHVMKCCDLASLIMLCGHGSPHDIR